MPSEAVEAPARRVWTPAERRRAIKAYKARGDRPVKEIAAEHGVSQPLLYHWLKREADGTLDTTPGKRPGKPPSTAITAASPAPIERRRGEQLELERLEPIVVKSTTRPTAPALTLTEHDELVLLRVEVRRLRRALLAYAELEEGPP
jgi:transposase-like protein